MAAWCTAGRWSSSRRTKRCSTGCSGFRWPRIDIMSAEIVAVAATDAVPRTRFDAVPLLLVLALALVAWPFVGSTSTWLTLTLAGLAMGMIIFITASGLTL